MRRAEGTQAIQYRAAVTRGATELNTSAGLDTEFSFLDRTSIGFAYQFLHQSGTALAEKLQEPALSSAELDSALHGRHINRERQSLERQAGVTVESPTTGQQLSFYIGELTEDITNYLEFGRLQSHQPDSPSSLSANGSSKN